MFPENKTFFFLFPSREEPPFFVCVFPLFFLLRRVHSCHFFWYEPPGTANYPLFSLSTFRHTNLISRAMAPLGEKIFPPFRLRCFLPLVAACYAYLPFLSLQLPFFRKKL